MQIRQGFAVPVVIYASFLYLENRKKSSIIFFVLAYFENDLIYLAATLFFMSNMIFLINCIVAIKKYINISKTDPMDLSSFK